MPTTPVGGLFACLSDVWVVLRPDDLTETYLPVEAWDSNGQAWVVGDTSLVAAITLPGFTRLHSDAHVQGRPDKARPPDIRRQPPVPPGEA